MNKVHASGAMGWGKKSPVPAPPAVGNSPEEPKEEPPVSLGRMVGKNPDTARHGEVQRQEAPKASRKEPTEGRRDKEQAMELRLEDLRLHDWVNGTGEPVDPVSKRMAGLKLNEKDI